jgi:hypothetical protein
LAPLGRRRVAPSLTLPRERGREGWGDRGQGAVGVPMKSNGLKSWWPGVSRRLKASP